MAIVFTSTTQANQSNGIKILVYGRAGHGKTLLCATAPRPVIISAESGLLSLRRSNLERLFGVGNPAISYDIPVAEINCIADLRAMYQWAVQSAEIANFDTICLDSISEIAEKLLAEEKKKVKDPRKAYGELIEQMTDLIRAFRDIKGKHVYFSAKQDRSKDEVTGVHSYLPSAPGQQLGPSLGYFFDEVFCLRIGKTADNKDFRYLQTQPDFQYDCKDRSGTLDAMERPELRHCFSKMLGI